MRAFALLCLVACSGEPFALSADGGAVDVLELDQGAELDVLEHEPTADVLELDQVHELDVLEHDATAVDVLEAAPPVDVASSCTPVTSIPYPPSCTTAVFGDCPTGSLDCVWTRFACAAGLCCRLDPLPNACHRCAESFACSCLAPLSDAGTCCDTDAGPYLANRCP